MEDIDISATQLSLPTFNDHVVHHHPTHPITKYIEANQMYVHDVKNCNDVFLRKTNYIETCRMQPAHKGPVKLEAIQVYRYKVTTVHYATNPCDATY